MVRPRVRIRFSKQSALRLIGHRDLMRSLERAFRRAGLSLGMSEGYRPKPRMHFPLALAVGMEGRREVMELELNDAPSADELLERLRPQAPAGLRFESLEILPPGSRKACAIGVSYQMAVPATRDPQTDTPVPGLPGLEERIQRLLAASTWPVRRPNRQTPVDARAGLVELALRDNIVDMRLAAASSADRGKDLPAPPAPAGPRDVLTALELDDLEPHATVLIRTDVEIAS
jgi:radical SAM-linked protein